MALAGKRVLVTRAASQAGELAGLLRARGAEPIVAPTIDIEPPRDPAPLARGVAALAAGAYDWVAFTSANAVAHVFDAFDALRAVGDAAVAVRAKIAVVGPKTARALAERSCAADLVAKGQSGESLAVEMLAVMPPRARVFLPRAALAADDLPRALRAAGCSVEAVVAYETLPPSEAERASLRETLARGGVDAVTFTSSSTVDNLVDALGPGAAEMLSPLAVASIGPKTTDTATRRGLRVDVTAQVSTVLALVDALEEFFSKPRI